MKAKKFTLQAYTACTLALLGNKNSDAQVVIKDFEPDLRMMNWRDDTLTRDTVTIDIDGNGIDDLSFFYEADGFWLVSTQLRISCADAVAFIGATDDFPWAYGFEAGYTIGPDLYWNKTYAKLNSFEVSLAGDAIFTSDWARIGVDQYLPIQLILEGEHHYGWLRLSSASVMDEDL